MEPRTWLQPVQYRSGRAGKPRTVHLRRVEYVPDGVNENGKPVMRVTSVSPSGLCGVRNVVPAEGESTCAQCKRIAAPARRQAEQGEA